MGSLRVSRGDHPQVPCRVSLRDCRSAWIPTIIMKCKAQYALLPRQGSPAHRRRTPCVQAGQGGLRVVLRRPRSSWSRKAISDLNHDMSRSSKGGAESSLIFPSRDPRQHGAGGRDVAPSRVAAAAAVEQKAVSSGKYLMSLVACAVALGIRGCPQESQA